jgi:3-methylcrotonyl-CoA carboxylase beta subunit
MEKIRTRKITDIPEFFEKKDLNGRLVTAYRDHLQRVVNRDNEPSVVKHVERGKMPVRRRISLLTDPATPFLEFSALAANGQYNDQFPSAGIVTGIGVIHGKPAVIVANDATVKVELT